MVEVLIAGAGPAGAVAALVLAREGVRVLLVDRARFPRPKLCGDTLNPGALDLLGQVGLRPDVERHGKPLEGMRVTSGRGVSVAAPYRGQSGLAITRAVLDELLVRAAASAGAQVQEEVRVLSPMVDASQAFPVVRGAVLATARGRVRVPAAWTIAADGRRSVLAFGMGLSAHPPQPRRWAVGAYYSGVSGLTAYGEMHLRARHYIGLAPLPAGLVNACVVTADRQRLARPLTLLDETLRQDPLLRERFAGATRESTVTCVGPLAVDGTACGTEGLLLAGDAAGFIDPMTGDGLRFAIQGGMLAAAAILRAQQRPPLAAHRWLAAARRQAFARKERLNRVLRALVATEHGVALGEVAARIAPGLIRALIRTAGDAPRGG